MTAPLDAGVERPPLLEAQSIVKRFGGVIALDAVSLSVAAGEVHAIVGENGAGKSTLGKIISGALSPDSGTILIDGRDHAGLSPVEAHDLGIAMVYQELSLVPWMTVEENLFLGRETKRRLGVLDRRSMRSRSREAFERLDIDLDPTAPVSQLSVAQCQLAEIARALLFEPRLVIMDEPSAVLGGANLERVLAIVRGLRDAGIGVVYVSHRLNEVFEVADRVTVLRDGRWIDTLNVSVTSIRELVRLMVGRDIPPPAPRKVTEDRKHVLSARALVVESGAPSVDLDLYAGEVVGVAGMVGSGRSSLVRTIAGAHSAASGRLTLDGRRVNIRKPADAIKHGICLIPEDRKNDGLLQPRSVAENISLASLDAVSRVGIVRSKLEQALAARQIKVADIRPPDPAVRVDALSGGNQQKVVVGKWLARKPRVLILDEPTRGIDVGAKSEIHRTIRALAEDGVAVLMVSSELPEILSASDRILVMRDGAIVTELRPEDANEEIILAHAVGHGGGEQPAGSTRAGGA